MLLFGGNVGRKNKLERPQNGRVEKTKGRTKNRRIDRGKLATPDLVPNQCSPLAGENMINLTLPPEVIDIQPRIVRRELNLDFGQIFYPTYKKVFSIRVYQSDLADDQENRKIIKAIVKFDVTLGTLNAFDERVFYILVELWQEQGKSETVYFSEREIARRLNVQWAGGDTAKTIQESLTRLRLVGIEWDGSFFHKLTDRLISISNPFTILSHLKTFTTKDEGIGSQIAEFRFDERVIQNLNSNYSRPILLDTVLSFRSPLAQSLYTYLEPRMYGTNHYHRTSVGLFIEDLGLVGATYKQKKVRVQAIKRARKELLGKRFYYDEKIEKVEIANGKQDAIFHVHRSGASKIKGRVIQIPHVAAQPNATTDTSKKHKPQNRRQAPSDPKGDVTPRCAAKTPSRASQGSYELLQCFAKVFYNDEQHEFDKNDVLMSEKIVKEHGIERAKYFVRFAHGEANQSNYKPQYFRGIKKYLKPAIESFERERRIAKRYQDEVDERKLKDAQVDHEKEYWDVYQEFVNERIEYIIDNHAERFDEFRNHQSSERLKIQERFVDKPKLQEQQLEIFDRPGQAVLRVVKYFFDDNDLHIPNFQEWDQKYNPNPFGKKPGTCGA